MDKNLQKPTKRDLQEARAARKVYENHYIGVNDVDDNDDLKKDLTSNINLPWGSHPEERKRRNRPGFSDRH